MIERINLVPQPPLAERIKKVTPWISAAALGVVILIVALSYFSFNIKLKKVDIQLKKQKGIVAQIDALQLQVKELTESVTIYKETNQKLESDGSALQIPRHFKKRFSLLFQAIMNVIPPSIRCTKISLKGNQGELFGMAETHAVLPDFVEGLLADPHIKRVSLAELDQAKGVASKIAYRITFVFN